MTLYFYTVNMGRPPRKTQGAAMPLPHLPGPAPRQVPRLFLIAPTPRRPLSKQAPSPPADLRHHAARVIAVTLRHWWP